MYTLIINNNKIKMINRCDFMLQDLKPIQNCQVSKAFNVSKVSKVSKLSKVFRVFKVFKVSKVSFSMFSSLFTDQMSLLAIHHYLTHPLTDWHVQVYMCYCISCYIISQINKRQRISKICIFHLKSLNILELEY